MIALLIRSPGYSHFKGQEALDMAMAMGTYGMETCVVFMDDGVFQLLPNQQADAIGFKNYAKGYAALPFYDIDEIYVCAKSIANRNIDPDKLLASPVVIAPEELQQKLRECHKVMSF